MAGILKTLFDITATKCPACRQGKMFKYPVYRLDKLIKVYDQCPVCGQDFRQEPGFYFGAMYFSYGLNIAVMVAFGIAYEVIFNPEETYETLLSVFIPAIAFIPLTFRVSRALNLYVFGKIKKKHAGI